MASNKKNTSKAKSVKQNDESYIKTYNPTKSLAGKIILLILVAGMFLGMVITAFYLMYKVATGR